MSDVKDYQQEAAAYHLTEKEAHSFIENVLSMTDFSQNLLDDKLAFLDKLIYTMHQTIPFQSVYRCSIPSKDRHRPSFSLIKEHMFKKYGGTCKTIQTFFKCLLDALGYKTDFFPITVLGQGHVGIIVHDLASQGSKHVVDVGCVSPTFTAIPFNFERESEIYSVSFLKYKYVRRADGIVEWLHQSRSDENDWFRFAEMEVTNLVTVSYFFETTERDFADPSNELNSILRISHYNGNCFFSVKDNIVKWSEEPQQKLLSKRLETKEEIATMLHEEFPQFPIEIIKQCVSNTLLTLQS
ncbi:uncharacterized protein [Apostichopus japonicus]|uniref:uncharacterized protein n=1 Tax=Stichopus japonicus TaxID=307972 RepID=UPI003AB4C67D